MFQKYGAKATKRAVRYFASLSSGWETVIGIEVHAQIKSKAKLFSNCPTPVGVGDEPNANVSAFDAAFPGTLPKLNGKCVELGVRTALALDAEVQPRSAFDRKHYFYPDLPAGYQITQNYAPFAKGGCLRLDKFAKTVRIKQIQLEQDTAKTIKDAITGSTLIDLNRAGTGLMEIVSEPDLRSPDEAGEYVRNLQALLRAVGASDGNMEQGSMRCDVNVSVNRTGESLGTRCEIKNLNSVKNLMIAINAEAHRHIGLLDQGQPVAQETRGFDENNAQTFRLRAKEDTPDYRYMPDPNLPPLLLTEDYVQRIRSSMPELPSVTKSRLASQYKLSTRDIEVLMSVDSGREVKFDGELGSGAVPFFETVTVGRDPKVAVNWIIHELIGQLAYRGETFQSNPISTEQMGDLIDSVLTGSITGTSGKILLRHILQTRPSEPVSQLIDQLSLRAVGASSLYNLCQAAITAMPNEASVFRAGNDKVIMRLVGHVMKASRGGADAKAASALLTEILRS